MNKPRVLYISYDGLTDPLGQSQVLPYLIHLSRLNYKITILSAEKEENFEKRRELIQNVCDEANIKWEFIKYSKKPPVISTIKDVRRLRKKAKSLHESQKFKIVHCRSYISAMVGLYMKKRFNTKFLFDMRGFWADERIDGEIWRLDNPIFKKVYTFFKKKEKEYLLNADATISLTYNGKNEIKSWDYFQGKKDNINVIPCCADLNHFDYNSIPKQKEIKAKLGIPMDDVVLVYLGSVGTWYMLDEMMDYFKLHVSIYPKTSFLWITKDDPSLIISTAERYNVRQKIVIKEAERFELPSMLSICDASIFFIKPLFSKKASSPTKMAELLGMGIPLICNSNVGDTDEIVKKEEVGVVLEEFTKEAYREAIDNFGELLNTPKERLRNVAQQYFSLEGGIEKYEEIYKKLS